MKEERHPAVDVDPWRGEEPTSQDRRGRVAVGCGPLLLAGRPHINPWKRARQANPRIIRENMNELSRM